MAEKFCFPNEERHAGLHRGAGEQDPADAVAVLSSGTSADCQQRHRVRARRVHAPSHTCATPEAL